jgi:hypothetical protein
LNERGGCKQPRFPYRRAKVEHSHIRIVKKHIGIVGFFGAGLGKEEVYLFVHFHVDVIEAEPAGDNFSSCDAPAEIEPPFTGRREPAGHSDRFVRTRVGLFPNWIIGRKRAVDVYGLGL